MKPSTTALVLGAALTFGGACSFSFNRAVRPGELRGRLVLARNDGLLTPAPGAHLALLGTSLAAASGADGRFSFVDLPPARFDLVVRADDTHAVRLAVDLETGAGRNGYDLGDIEIAATGAVVGTVTSGGAPFAGAHVVAEGFGDALTGADGRYRLELPAGGYHAVAVTTSLGAQAVAVQIAPHADARADFALSPATGSLTGNVHLAGLSDDSGAIVSLLHDGALVRAFPATTAPGAYSGDGLPSGLYALRASRDGFEDLVLDGVAVAPGVVVPTMTLLPAGSHAGCAAPSVCELPSDGGSSDAGGSDAGDGGGSDAGGSDAGDGGGSDAGGSDAGDGGSSDAGGSDAGDGGLVIPAAPLTACFIRDQCPARAPCATTATGAWLSFKGTTYEGETFDQIAILPLPADATTAKVEVLVDGVSVWRMPYAATLPPEATWNMAQYPDKSAHTITCNAYDSAGAWTETSTVHVTVNECDRDHDGVPADHAQVAQCPAAAASDCDDSDPAVGSCSGATNACFVAATGAGACGCSVSPDSCVASGGMCNGAASPPVCRAGCALDSDCGAGFFCARALGSGGAWKPTTCTAYCVDDAHCGAGHYCGAADDVASHFACLTCNLAATGPNGTEAHCGTVTTPAGCVACSAGNTLCHNGACTCQSAGTTADTCFAVYTGVCSSGGTCGTCRVDADCASIGGTCASPTCIPGGGWSGIGQFPDERIGASLVYSMVGGIKQVVLFGGRTPAGAGLSDVWVLSVNPASFQDLAWHRVAFDGVTPPARAFHSATMSGTSMIVFGGQLIGPGGTVLGDAADVWQLTLPWQGYGGGFWTQLATPRNAPPPRHSASAVDVYDSLGNDRVVVFGGLHVDPATGAKTLYNDAWSLLLELGGNNAMGWTQLAPTGTPPSPRWGAAGAYDSTNQQLVVYGGNTTAAAGAPTATDAFTLSLVFGKTPVWSPLAPSGNGPGPLDSAVAVYDDAASQMLLFGGAGPTGAPMNDVWSLLLSGTGAPSWMLLAPGPTRPAGGTGYAAAFSPTASTYGLDVFAGNELWTLPSSLSGQWRELAVAPVERDHLAMTWDGANNRVVMFGGMGGVGALMNHPLADTALWSNRYGVWTQLPGSGPAAFSVSTQGTLLNDAADGRYVLFIPRATGPEVWTYTVASATWRRVTTSGGGPASYFSTSAVLDPNGGTPQVVVFGGQDQTGTYLGDTWVLSLLDGSWTMLPAAPAGLGARASHAAIIDAANNRMLVYGGRTINPITSALTNHFDVWALSLPASASSVWTQVSASGTPAHAPAGPPLAVYDANAGGAPRMLVFDSTFPDSSWQLSLAPGAEAWTRLCPAFHPPASLAGRAFGAAVMSPGGLLTYGGSSGSALDNWVWQLASTAPLAVGGACPP